MKKKQTERHFFTFVEVATSKETRFIQLWYYYKLTQTIKKREEYEKTLEKLFQLVVTRFAEKTSQLYGIEITGPQEILVNDVSFEALAKELKLLPGVEIPNESNMMISAPKKDDAKIDEIRIDGIKINSPKEDFLNGAIKSIFLISFYQLIRAAKGEPIEKIKKEIETFETSILSYYDQISVLRKREKELIENARKNAKL